MLKPICLLSFWFKALCVLRENKSGCVPSGVYFCVKDIAWEMAESHVIVKARRRNQDYTSCLGLFPTSVWSRLMKMSSDRQRAEEICVFCHSVLQLRLPTERTYATWTSLLASFDPQCSTFDLRTKNETVKNVWHGIRSRLERGQAQLEVLILKLPGTFGTLW